MLAVARDIDAGTFPPDLLKQLFAPSLVESLEDLERRTELAQQAAKRAREKRAK